MGDALVGVVRPACRAKPISAASDADLHLTTCACLRGAVVPAVRPMPHPAAERFRAFEYLETPVAGVWTAPKPLVDKGITPFAAGKSVVVGCAPSNEPRARSSAG